MRFGGSLICPIGRSHLRRRGDQDLRREEGRDKNQYIQELYIAVSCRVNCEALSLSLTLFVPRVAQATECRRNFHRADKKIASCALGAHT